MRDGQMVNEEDEAKFRCEIAPIALSLGPQRDALAVSMARLGAGKLGQALDR